MGIKKINSLITEKNKYLNNRIQISKFKNSIIGVDLYNFLYKALYNNDNIIEYFIKQINIFFKNNILPVYIFDGNNIIEKYKIINKRKEKKIKIKNRIQRLKELKNQFNENYQKIIDDKIHKLQKNLIYISDDDIIKLKELFNIAKIPYIYFENYEADLILSQLSKKKIVDYVLSDDFDILVYGSINLLKNFSFTFETVQYYNLENILKNLKYTHEQFLTLGCLFGSDYSNKLIGYSYDNIVDLVNKYKNITNISNFINLKDKKSINNLYEIKNAINIFSKKLKDEEIIYIKNKIKKKFIDSTILINFLNKEIVTYNIFKKKFINQCIKFNSINALYISAD